MAPSEAGNAPVTPLGSQVCVDGGDHLPSDGAIARLSFENAIKKYRILDSGTWTLSFHDGPMCSLADAFVDNPARDNFRALESRKGEVPRKLLTMRINFDQ
ncbi:hypothetical protein EVAR_68459_1 [Eumeta japonica]|uniref:Uncharacterized protein n=1 Tax=Eumeta variegata TaxID=151549 RepID=A0A4C2A025_EUMVA|nr:hypothetical protein EVAR_68459_1 [Eumeta japonica]